jgi:hypothetical protein
VVGQDLHPTIKYLLLRAMRRVHSRAAMFTRGNELPAAEAIGLRLSDVATQFYLNPSPFSYRFLPYWIADMTAA